MRVAIKLLSGSSPVQTARSVQPVYDGGPLHIDARHIGPGMTNASKARYYQRNNRGPSNAPMPVGIKTPSRYQVPRNGAAISGQYSV